VSVGASAEGVLGSGRGLSVWLQDADTGGVSFGLRCVRDRGGVVGVVSGNAAYNQLLAS